LFIATDLVVVLITYENNGVIRVVELGDRLLSVETVVEIGRSAVSTAEFIYSIVLAVNGFPLVYTHYTSFCLLVDLP